MIRPAWYTVTQAKSGSVTDVATPLAGKEDGRQKCLENIPVGCCCSILKDDFPWRDLELEFTGLSLLSSPLSCLCLQPYCEPSGQSEVQGSHSTQGRAPGRDGAGVLQLRLPQRLPPGFHPRQGRLCGRVAVQVRPGQGKYVSLEINKFACHCSQDCAVKCVRCGVFFLDFWFCFDSSG